jgi:outer membrane protein assembly factor BamB
MKSQNLFRATLLICLATVTGPALAAMTLFAMAGEWRSHFVDPANSGRAQVTGPDNPGLKWHMRLSDMVASFAPEGYRVVTNTSIDRPMVAPDGTLIMIAKNRNTQYENPHRFANEVIGINPDNGNVIWEIGNALTTHESCRPALDSQGLLWVHLAPASNDDDQHWRLHAFNPETGTPISGTSFVTNDITRCRRTSLHIGGKEANERLVMYGSGGDPGELLVLDISGPAPQIHFQLASWTGLEAISGVPLNSYQHRIGVFTDDSLIVGARVTSGHRILLRFPLDSNDSDDIQQMEMPTPEGKFSGDFWRMRMVTTDNGNLLISPQEEDDGVAFVAKVHLEDDGMSTAWVTSLPNTFRGARDLTLLNNAVQVRVGQSWNNATVLSIDTGEVLWDGVRAASRTIADPGEAASSGDIIFQDGFAPVGASGSIYTSTREPGQVHDRLIVSYDARDGSRRWIIQPSAILEAAGVEELTDLGLGDFRSLQLGAIGHDGTLYITNTNSALDGILAINNSGGLTH